MHRFLVVASLVVFVAACDGAPPAPPDAGPEERPVILEVVSPEPAVQGSLLEVRGLGLDRLGASPLLFVDRDGAPVSTLEPVTDVEDGRLLFELSADAVTQLGAGIHTVEVRASGAGLESDPFVTELRLVSTLDVDLFEGPSGEAHSNDVAVVTGAGIIGRTEGTLEARFAGTYTLDEGGATSAVDARLPVSQLERHDRERGVVVLTTDLGGLFPGTFEGTVQLVSTLVSGASSESLALDTTLHFNPPDLYGLDPLDASIGQILTVRGAGFLGGPDRGDEGTLIALSGTFTPAGGGAAEPFEDVIVPSWISGDEVQLLLETTVTDGVLVSALFGHARGSFVGMATPITTKGTDELEGTAVPFGFTLGAIRQVVFVRFLPGFYDSLSRFGLTDAAPEIEAGVLARMEGIFGAWNVDLRLESPTDFSRTSYSIVEIGGPDPNGVGLFGYDNTPGKDIGNLRLFDVIGGTNAQTQSDGYPGYGGVFVESFLYWSSHPDLPGERPTGAPDAEPVFDEIFDPVRALPATRAEARGEGASERVSAVRRAVDAFSSIVGETTSHEIGHSLGMAQPDGPPTVYHNDFDGDGCLMDSGSDRPLGERMGLSGFTTTQLCHDHPTYMSRILAP